MFHVKHNRYSIEKIDRIKWNIKNRKVSFYVVQVKTN